MRGSFRFIIAGLALALAACASTAAADGRVKVDEGAGNTIILTSASGERVTLSAPAEKHEVDRDVVYIVPAIDHAKGDKPLRLAVLRSQCAKGEGTFIVLNPEPDSQEIIGHGRWAQSLAAGGDLTSAVAIAVCVIGAENKSRGS